jgi:predicted nucleic acid-binding protein
MKIVSDASPLIFLAKINRLNFLGKYDIIIPDQVYAEIKVGKEKQKLDFVLVDELVQKGRIRVAGAEQLENFPFNLGRGEREVISLAMRQKINLVLMDDKKGRLCAKLKGLRARGVLAVIIQQYKVKKINKESLKKIIFELLMKGFRIKEELVIELLKEIE